MAQYSTHLFRHTRAQIGRNIYQLRVKHGLTLQKIAKCSGVPLEKLDQYEIGKNEISVADLLKIACVFGTEISEMVK